MRQIPNTDIKVSEKGVDGTYKITYPFDGVERIVYFNPEIVSTDVATVADQNAVKVVVEHLGL